MYCYKSKIKKMLKADLENYYIQENNDNNDKSTDRFLIRNYGSLKTRDHILKFLKREGGTCQPGILVSSKTIL